MFLTTHLTSFCFLAAAALPLVQPQESQEPTSSARRAGPAQRAKPSRSADEAKKEVRVYDLDYADPNAIASACQATNLPVRVSANQRQRWLVASGRAEDLEILESLIERLERAAARTPPPPENQVLIVKLEHASARATASTLHSVLRVGTGPGTIRVAVDEPTNALIITGEPETVRTAADLIEQLDQSGATSVAEPTGALNLSFYFLRGSIGVGNRGTQTALPKALRHVSAALAESGFVDLELMAPVYLVADPGTLFEQSWKIKSDHQGLLAFIITGSAKYGDDETIRASISAKVEATIETRRSSGNREAADTPGREKVFAVLTDLRTKLDEYFVLAASPASTADGDAIVLVMKVSQR